ncbi:MAG TPA: hypothetical protein VFD82_03250, partial [Planctomycetota bacterium]|nr:hypothetical protein [Planctomycetota bacterium]
VSFAGRSCAIRNSNGMEYLGQLLASPDKPIHTWTLKHKEEPPTQSSDDVIMDAESIDDVRRRVSQLQDLLNESDDALTRERAQEEIDKLQTELRSATEGTQSGRTLRHSRHPIEQTREAVGKAIQRAIEAIEEYLPELARHLRECVASPTGMSPCYRPPPEAPTWQVSLGTVSGRARDA